MKKLNEKLSAKDIKSLRRGYVSVYEKMDMIYFKVAIKGKGDFEVRSKKGNVFTQVDCVCNSFVNEVVNFANSLPADRLFDDFGQIVIGFFYHPKRVKRFIEYNNIPDDTFILSDYYVKDKEKRDDYLIIEILSPFCPYNVDIGTYMFNFRFSSDSELNVENVKRVVKERGLTFSGNDVDDIEGVILRTVDGKAFSVPFKETPEVDDKISRLLYRDMIVADFLSVMSDKLFTIKANDYVTHMSRAFVEYINSTDIFNRMCIESEDLLPPANGNVIGNLSTDLLDPIMTSICANPLYANTFRVLLMAFSPFKKSLDAFRCDVWHPELMKMTFTFFSNKYITERK